MKAGNGGGLPRVDGDDKGRCRWCCRRTGQRRRRGDTAKLSNLELEGGRHVPSLLSRGVDCSDTVTGGLGSSVEGSQGIAGRAGASAEVGAPAGADS
jgi:hypothetical protein